jgi:hypothetical protein
MTRQTRNPAEIPRGFFSVFERALETICPSSASVPPLHSPPSFGWFGCPLGVVPVMVTGSTVP